ncbi:histidine phosphatase superfamily [Kockovaella imperatae]|uniref:Histidine phosphatase superfamily n=1 Tax=Kockovaella imperatae TaxID=4999 RepID=A0A1Y1U9E0_9TREE|nr:histidine phosphatase superfamily [Kockovaella imperatae]ORX34649.1 histidine phosphatase superfamily [Kockovaella imperatae]
MSRIPATAVTSSTTPLLSSDSPRPPSSRRVAPPSQPRTSPSSALRPPIEPNESYVSYASIPRSNTPPPRFISRSRSRLAAVRRRQRTPIAAFFPAFVTIVLLGFASFAAWDVSSAGNCWIEPLCRILGSGDRLENVWWRNSGAYAPWKSLGPGGGKRGLPRGCKVNQVTVLQRHAARYPTTEASKCLLRALGKLANRKTRTPRRHHSELAFLSDTDLRLEDWKFDQLLDQGRRQAWSAGREIAALYAQFLDTNLDPFTRASGSGRVVETAGYWLEGFRGDAFKLKPVDQLPQVNLTLPEEPTFNNTLSVKTCPAFANQSAPSLPDLLNLLQPAQSRLNDLLRPQPPLELSEVKCLADMCPYDSQRSETWAAWSRWCRVFTREEWEAIGYLKDVDRYYGVGPGNDLGPTLGAGWTNELIARLTDSAPVDSTTTNSTLDADEASFPRGGNRLFVDFTHDNEMIEIMAAMGLARQHGNLLTDKLPDKRSYMISELIPFGSRIVFERIGCQLGNWEPDPEGGQPEDERKNYLRVFINDALDPLDSLMCSQSGFFEHGMCEVDIWVDSQSFAQKTVDWNVCYAK